MFVKSADDHKYQFNPPRSEFALSSPEPKHHSSSDKINLLSGRLCPELNKLQTTTKDTNQLIELENLCLSQQQKIEDLQLKVHQFESLTAKYINSLLEDVFKELIKIISSSKELQQRLGIKNLKQEMNLDEIMKKIIEHLEKEQEPDDLEEFIKSDRALDNFIWCTPDADDLIPCLLDLSLVLSSYTKENGKFNWDPLLLKRLDELSADEKSGNFSYVKAGLSMGVHGVYKGTKITYQTIKITIQTLTWASQILTFVGVAALVLESPWTPLLGIVLQAVLKKLLHIN